MDRTDKPLRVLVCGGRQYGVIPRGSPGEGFARAYSERGIMCRALDRAKDEGATVILHGGASGADAYAAQWAIDNGLSAEAFRADWKKHGRAAGPIRNRRMIEEGKPDLVLAFSGGRGTEDCVRQALAAGVSVRRIA